MTTARIDLALGPIGVEVDREAEIVAALQLQD